MAKLLVVTFSKNAGPNRHSDGRETLRDGALLQRMQSHRPSWTLYFYRGDGSWRAVMVSFPRGPYSPCFRRIAGRRLRWPWRSA